MTSAPPSLTQHPSLQTYVTLLKKWQPRINLIGPKTLRDIWVRHVQDSAQLLDHLPPILQEQTGQNQPSNQARRLVDFGSGAGFPGLVLAILRPDLDVHLVESDQRKGAFLREVARETGAKITLHSQRIEKLKPLDAHIITALQGDWIAAEGGEETLFIFGSEMHSYHDGDYADTYLLRIEPDCADSGGAGPVMVQTSVNHGDEYCYAFDTLEGGWMDLLLMGHEARISYRKVN